jgi:integrase
MIERAAAGAGLEIKAHPHMLRHACGYTLANKGPTHGLFRAGSAIGRSPGPPSIRRWRRIGSRISGESERCRHPK